MEDVKDVSKSTNLQIGRLIIDCGSVETRNKLSKELELLAKYSKAKKSVIESLLENKVSVKITLTVDNNTE